MKHTLNELRKKLADERSKKILIVSHCLLNQNTRYLGGAFCKGVTPGMIETALEKGYGIVQMPCPEQQAWGGVLKKYMWLGFGKKRTLIYKFRGILLPLFLFYIKYIYKRIARNVVKELIDYHKSGFQIIGIVGIDGSPTCGVKASLDMARSFEFFASLDPGSIDRNYMNNQMYKTCLVERRGLFISEIKNFLRKRGMHIAVFSHSILDEIKGNYACQLD
jgi:predicted secreted protein